MVTSLSIKGVREGVTRVTNANYDDDSGCGLGPGSTSSKWPDLIRPGIAQQSLQYYITWKTVREGHQRYKLLQKIGPTEKLLKE